MFRFDLMRVIAEKNHLYVPNKCPCIRGSSTGHQMTPQKLYQKWIMDNDILLLFRGPHPMEEEPSPRLKHINPLRGGSPARSKSALVILANNRTQIMLFSMLMTSIDFY